MVNQLSILLESIGNGDGDDAIPESHVNVATRKVKYLIYREKVIGRAKMGLVNVLAL